MRSTRTLVCGGVLLATLGLAASFARAEEEQDGEWSTQQWRIGIVIRAEQGGVRGLTAATPVPLDWPEQQVRLVSEEKSPTVRSVRYRELDGGVRQMVLSVPVLRRGEEARAEAIYEIRRRKLAAPADLHEFTRAPKSTATAAFLGASPGIETTDAGIRGVSEKLGPELEGLTPVEQVEHVYDWVRANVRYEFDKELRGAAFALERGVGDCEELTSLFIALCRNEGVPARMVWVEHHCYPEFYLLDPQGEGRWIPCQAAGDRQFGAIGELRPIWQKGDRFRIPGQREPVRYAAETVAAQDADAPPVVQAIREPVE